MRSGSPTGEENSFLALSFQHKTTGGCQHVDVASTSTTMPGFRTGRDVVQSEDVGKRLR